MDALLQIVDEPVEVEAHRLPPRPRRAVGSTTTKPGQAVRVSPRRILSVALAVVAGVCALVGGVGAYARSELVDADAFAERASASLRHDEVRELIAEKVVDGLISEASGDLLVVRPLLESGIGALASTAQFRGLFEFAIRDAHRVLIGDRDSSVILDLDRAGALLIDALRGISPRVAEEIPGDAEPQLARLDADDLEVDSAQALRSLAGSATTFLLVALLAAACSVAVSERRRTALSRLGVAVAAAGAVSAVAVEVVGRIVAAEAAGAADEIGSERATASTVAGLVWNDLFGDLRDLSLSAAVAGVACAAVAGGSIQPGSIAAALRRLQPLMRSPEPAARVARGLGALVLGVAIAVEPDMVVRVAAGVLCLGLLVVGVSELSAVIARERPERSRRRRLSERPPLFRQIAVGAAVVAATAAAGLAGAEVLARPTGAATTAAPPAGGCNGSVALCERRINEVAFPATHNSFSAAEEPGWLFANQRHGIARQLTDGVRGLLLDVHYGVREPGARRIRTDLEASGSTRNRVARRLDPEALRVADRLAGRVGLGNLRGRRSLYLCHTLSELGSEPLAEQLAVIRTFIRANPNEVIVLLFEPYVPPAEIERALEESELLEATARLRRDRPLPTLGDLIRDRQQLVVFTERGAAGRPWYHDAFAFMQDTPLGGETRRDFTCERFRGTDDSPLLTLNHWVDRFPPQPSANRRIGGAFLRERAQRCEAARGLVPNLIPVDFYERTGVVDVARAINEDASR